MPSQKQLEGFFEVAETGSFNKASKNLFISSTALLQQLNLLETELGFPLFNRTKKGVSLTKAGEYYYTESKKLYNGFLNAAIKAKSIADALPDVIRVGHYSGVALIAIMEINQKLAPKHQYRLSPTQTTLPEAEKLLIQGQLDCCLLPVGPALRSMKLAYTTVYSCKPDLAITPSNTRLCGKEKISLADLDGETLILPEPGIYDSADAIRREITSGRIRAKILSINSSVEAELACIQNNACRLASVPHAGSPLVLRSLLCDITHEIALAYPKERESAFASFLDLIRPDIRGELPD